MPRSKTSSASKRKSSTSSSETKEDICGQVSLATAHRALQAMDKAELCSIISKAGWQQIRAHEVEKSSEKKASGKKRGSAKKATSAKKSGSAKKVKVVDQYELANLWQELHTVLGGNHLGLTTGGTLDLADKAAKVIGFPRDSCISGSSYVDLSALKKHSDPLTLARWKCSPKLLATTADQFIKEMHEETNDPSVIRVFTELAKNL